MLLEETKSKQELVDWINNMDNQDMLNELLLIKERASFYERFNKGLSSSEARLKSIDFMKSCNWKKQ
jgi:hypothetical protein